jgi:hypothetical protein
VSRQHVAGATPHKSHSPWPWLGAIAGVICVIVLISVVAVVASNNGKGPQPTPCANPCKNPPPGKGPQPPRNPPRTAPPAEGQAVAAQHTYTSSSLGYTVQYNDSPQSAPWLGQADNGSPAPQRVVVQDDHQLGFVYDLSNYQPNGDPWFASAQYPFGYTGVSAGGKSAQQLVEDYVSTTLPGAEKVYEIPNARVGYQPGYGAVYDVTARTPDGQSFHARAMVVAAVKGDAGVIVSGVGYYYVETSGHPNPADTIFAHFWSILPAQVTFKGERPL